MSHDAVSAAIAQAFREERAVVLATLIRQVGDFQLAEDAVQDAFAARGHGVAARRRAGQPGRVDHHRRRAGGRSTACAATARSPTAPSGWPS